jgi:hypothetical protein
VSISNECTFGSPASTAAGIQRVTSRRVAVSTRASPIAEPAGEKVPIRMIAGANQTPGNDAVSKLLFHSSHGRLWQICQPL